MELSALLARQRAEILSEWRRRIFETYPAPAADLFRRGKDRFLDPAGDAIRRGTEAVLDALGRDASREELAAALDPIVRLRAVQDFMPSRAVAFVLDLKDALRGAAGPAAEVAEIDGRIDGLLLIAFDVYSACRERIGEIRLAEAKARLFKKLERAERVRPEPEVSG